MGQRGWDVLLIAGASGVRPTSVNSRLAQHFGVGVTEVDHFQVTLEQMTARAQFPELHPQIPIRRFDVFAEYSRLERLDKGYPQDEAKGYGIWLAKLVAARRGGKTSDASGMGDGSGAKGKPGPEPKFRSLGDELQTDETFDEDIVERMGTKFYAKVFAPAIEDARKAGKSYEDIRDAIRREWKPKKAAGRT